MVDPNTAMSGGSVYYALRVLRSNVLRALFVCGGVSVASAHNTSLFACDGEALRPLLTLRRHASSPDPSANAADAPIVIDAASASAAATSATSSSFFVLHAPLPAPTQLSSSSSSPHEPLRSNVAVLAYASPWDIAVVRMRRDMSARAFAADVAPEWLRRRCAIMGSPLLFSTSLSSAEGLSSTAEGASQNGVGAVTISLGDVLKGGLRLQCLVDVATGALTLLPPPIPPIGDGEGIVISDAVVDASVALDCGLGARTRLSLRSRYAAAAASPGDGEGFADDGDDADDEEGPFDFYYVLDAQRNEGGKCCRLRGLGAAGAQLSLELTAPLPTFRLVVG